MVTVPNYDNFHEQPTVRQGRASSPLGIAEAQRGARQIQEVGKGLSSAGGAVEDIVQKEQEKANKIRVNDAFNQASAAAADLRYNRENGYLRLKGGDAAKGVNNQPLADHYDGELAKRLDTIRKGLGNEAVQGMFDLAAGDLRTKFKNDAISYEAEQASVYEQQVRDATIMTSANEIASDPTGTAVLFNRNRAASAAIATARAAGLQGKVAVDANNRITWETNSTLGTAVSAAIGKVHTAVVMSMLDNKNVAGAKAYFEAHEADYSELDAAEVRAKLKVAYDGAKAVADVSDVLKRVGPREYNQPWRSSTIDDELRKKYVDDPAGLKAARAEMDERRQNFTFQETEQNATNGNSVWDMLNSGQTMAQVESSRAWLALPGASREALKNAYLNRRDDPSYADDNAQAYWLSLINNDTALAAMTPAQVQALEPRMGRTLTQQLDSRRRQILDERATKGAQAATASGKIDNDLFNTIATQYGLKPFDTRNTANQTKVARLRSRLETTVAQEQAAKGKVLTPGEMNDFLRKQMAVGVVVQGGAVQRAATLSPEDATKIAATGRARDIVVNYLASQYEATGLPEFEPTEQNIERVRAKVLGAAIDSGQFFVDE